MIQIRPLESVPISTIHKTFLKAFSDYAEPVNLTAEELQYMIERRGYNPKLSFGVFDGHELAGFTLNGTGLWNNIPTAYDTGTGMVKEYRKQGFATRLFDESLPFLRQAGIGQYLLEVIRTNTKAFDLYSKAGFEVTRRFEYYTVKKEELKLSPVDLPHTGFRETTIDEALKNASFRSFEPSWQNSNLSLQRKPGFFKTLCAFVDDTIAGYIIAEPHTGDIPRLAIAEQHRRKGLATALFSRITREITAPVVKIINVPSDYEPFDLWAKSLGFKPGFGQYEMIKTL